MASSISRFRSTVVSLPPAAAPAVSPLEASHQHLQPGLLLAGEGVHPAIAQSSCRDFSEDEVPRRATEGLGYCGGLGRACQTRNGYPRSSKEGS